MTAAEADTKPGSGSDAMDEAVAGVAEALAAHTGGSSELELDGDRLGKGLAHLVLTLVKLLHELLERQAIARMEGGSLDSEEVDRLGRALAAQAEEIREMAQRFGLDERDLNLDLGPLGRAL